MIDWWLSHPGPHVYLKGQRAPWFERHSCREYTAHLASYPFFLWGSIQVMVVLTAQKTSLRQIAGLRRGLCPHQPFLSHYAVVGQSAKVYMMSLQKELEVIKGVVLRQPILTEPWRHISRSYLDTLQSHCLLRSHFWSFLWALTPCKFRCQITID